MDSLYDLALFLLIYSFVGWAAEAGWYAVTRRKFCNRGILSLPLVLCYGFTFDLLILVLPTLAGHPILSFLAVMVITSVTEGIADHFFHRVGPKIQWQAEHSRLLSGTGKGLLASLAVSAVYYIVYLIIHPLLLAGVLLLPKPAKAVIVWIVLALIALDFAAVFYAVRTGDASQYQRRQAGGGQGKLAARIYNAVWKRLRRAYPDIQAVDGDAKRAIFAKGLCWDKLVWVFLISALLGDVIETFWCGLVDGQWMNRSSVLYGPFSFVWGLGAVVLTVTLQRLAEKNDRYVFAAGFVIGGVYEYMCSVFTELVFGTVFWDYSEMPLNIGGRTNVLFCFFWGVLAVAWIKMIYPPMSKGIESLPALTGKILTWVVVFVMACNAVLTSAAMLRYSTRPEQPQPANAFEEFIDRQYGDGYMERRWPNMVATGGGEE
jgi:uncharacterized membrane protein